MTFTQLILTLPPQQAEQLSELLEAWGAVATTFTDAADQPLYEPELHTTPLWQETRLTALFTEDADINAVLDFLFSLPSEQRPLSYQLETLPDQDWIKNSLDSFKPLQFGKNLWVCPSWQAIPDPQAINVILDPGLAFGTGTHATTALCLQWLGSAIEGGENVIDYGCGSGILAIAALC
jgi:ribosomal protein L11 methyltransferase